MLKALPIAICGLLLSGCYVFDDWGVVAEGGLDIALLDAGADGGVDALDFSNTDQGVGDDGLAPDGSVAPDMPASALLQPARVWFYGSDGQSVESTTLEVTTALPWTITLPDGVADWATVEPVSGVGPATVTVTIDADPMPGREQTFDVVLAAGDDQTTSTVTFAYGVPVYFAERLAAPALDGACDEYVSEEIQLVTPKRQEVTRAWLGWDESGLWICVDSTDIQLMTAKDYAEDDHDELIWYGDGVAVRLDPGRTRDTDTSYYFGVAITGHRTESKGARYEGRSWNQVWDAVTELHGQGVNDEQLDPEGWRAEMHLPFSALDGHQPPVSGDRWVFNLEIYDRDDSGDNGGWPADADNEPYSIGAGAHLVFEP